MERRPAGDANRATLIQRGEGVKFDETSVVEIKSRGFVTAWTELVKASRNVGSNVFGQTFRNRRHGTCTTTISIFLLPFHSGFLHSSHFLSHSYTCSPQFSQK